MRQLRGVWWCLLLWRIAQQPLPRPCGPSAGPGLGVILPSPSACWRTKATGFGKEILQNLKNGVVSGRKSTMFQQSNLKGGNAMANCEMLLKCIFFNDKMANKPGTANLMKEKYCKGDFQECARYKVCKTLGRDKVPGDLFPSQMDRVRQLLKQ
ncbi:hypothetical protein [Megalodesulfovibrio gigas]|nr:hypothetical protein [Megalodesulfovibrio gigas]